MKTYAAVLVVCLGLAAAPSVLADPISFTSSNELGGQLRFTSTGPIYGLRIPITALTSDGKTVEVSGGVSGGVSGWLQFETGDVISASSKGDVFASGGTMRVIGMFPGDTKDVVLLTATFVGPVTVSELSNEPKGGSLALTGNIQITGLAPSVTTAFPGLNVPITRLIIHAPLRSNGSFSGKATTENLGTVPEAGSIVLFGSGLLGVAAVISRNRKRKSLTRTSMNPAAQQSVAASAQGNVTCCD
jgi:hypothetical protein